MQQLDGLVSPATLIASKVGTAPRNPSPMTTADIAGYRAIARPPVCGQYRVWRICGMGPPSSGATTVFAILKQLERFDMKKLDRALAEYQGVERSYSFTRFGPKAATIKLGTTAAVIGIEYLIVKKWPSAARALTRLNWGSSALTAGFAVHNYALR